MIAPNETFWIIPNPRHLKTGKLVKGNAVIGNINGFGLKIVKTKKGEDKKVKNVGKSDKNAKFFDESVIYYVHHLVIPAKAGIYVITSGFPLSRE